MADRDPQKLDLDRFRAIVAAYGADPKRWPEAERAAAEAILVADQQAAMAREAEAELDAALALDRAPAPTPELMAAVLAAADRARPRGLAVLWPLGPLWQPASALAAAAVLGLVLGAALPDAVLPGARDADVALALQVYVQSMEALP